MAKSVHDSVLDAALNFLKANTQKMHLCSAQPANYAAVAGVSLANVALAGGDFTGPADGDVSGRKITIGQKLGVDVTATGTGTHIALVDDTNSLLRFVDTCANVNVDAAGTVDIGSWKVEIADPA